MSTKVLLYWRTSIDKAHHEHNLRVRIIRLVARLCFRKPDGWSQPLNAIVDTGNPVTLLPRSVWQEIFNAEILSEPIVLSGVGKGALKARLAKIEVAFISTRKEIVTTRIKAYFAEEDTVPLLVGVEDLLTSSRLVCDYPKSKTFLQITSRRN